MAGRELARLSRQGSRGLVFGDPEKAWDYKAATVDREGRPLPKGALGWTQEGDPYYGSAVNQGLQAQSTLQGRLGIVTGPITNQFTEWWSGVQNRWDWYKPNGKDPTTLQRAGQIIKEGVMGIGEAWNVVVTLPVETAAGVYQGAQEAGEGSPLPDIEEGLRQVLPRGWFTEYVLNMNPLLQGWNALRLVTSPKGIDEKDKILLANIAASRIAYSAWKDPALRNEYIRRFEAGEDPYQLSRELRRPWAEFWGQLLLDWTNMFMVAGWMTKFGKGSRSVAEAQKAIGATDEIRSGINAMKSARSDTQFMEAGERLVAASRAESVALTENVARSARGTDLWALTADSQRAMMAEEAGTFSGLLFAHYKDDPERVVEIMRLLMSNASDDAGEVMAAVGELSHYPIAPYLMGRSGKKTGLLLRQMFTGADGAINIQGFLDDVAKVQDDTVKAAEFFGNLIDRGAKKLIPTVAERVKAGEDVPQLVRQLENLANQRGPIGTINRFFANIYMRWSPGYAARNSIQNWFHMFTDYGTGVFQRTPATASEVATKWLQYSHPAMERGIGLAHVAGADVSKWARWVPGRVAQDMERNAAKMVVGHAVDRSMRSMMIPGRALPDIKPLVEAGLSPEAVRFVVNQVVNNYGDTAQAEKAIRTALAVGVADNFRNLEFLRPAQLRYLQKEYVGGMSLYDRIVQGIRQITNPEEAAEVIRDIFKAIDDEAARAGGQALAADAAVLAERPIASAVVMAEASRKGIALDEAHELVVIRETIGGKAIQEATLAAEAEIGRLGEALARNAIDPQVGGALMQEAGALHKQASARRIAIETAAAKLRDEAAAAYRGVKAGSPEAQAIWERFAERITALHRDAHAEALVELDRYLNAVASVVPDYDASNMERALRALEEAAKWDNATVRNGKFVVEATGKELGAVGEAAQELEGVLRPGAEAAQAAPEAGAAVEAAQELARPYLDLGAAPSPAQYYRETATTRNNILKAIEAGLTDHWGEQVSVAPAQEVITQWLRQADGGIAEARLLSAKVGQAARDFTLLNYTSRKGIDTVLGMLFPYQYWYSRTYLNWMRRLSSNPQIVTNYAKYRRALETAHADAPDWWKYQVNTNELLGLDSENPFYFNLEATLNPINGLVGVDFENRDRRQGWFANTIDDLGKFGPTVWTPISLAIATAHYMKGENDAAAAWAGRLIPQTASLKNVLSMFRGKVSDLPLHGEYDPAVWLFSGGIDPYEKRRVARALGGMIQDGTIDPDTAAEVGRTQQGPYWNEALDRAVNQRAPGQLASFMFGVGFKPRTQADIQTDQFYADYFRLQEMRPLLSPEEWRTSWDNLRQAYPFMDAMLLARKDDDERDRAYAYNVLSRIPPAHQDDFAEIADLPQELLTQFHETKGDMTDWAEGDRMRFMEAMVNLGAILRSPDDATRAEWTKAKNLYDDVYAQGRRRFGNDIWDRVDTYYGAKGPTDAEQARAESILNSDPEIGAALDFKSGAVMASPLLIQYYASLNSIEGYYEGQMWGAIERKLGSDIWDKWDEYYRQENRRAYWNSHPELQQYVDMRDQWRQIISERIVEASNKLRDITPEQRRGELGIVQSGIAAQMEAMRERGYPQLSWDEWQSVLGPSLSRLVVDYAMYDDPMPQSGVRSLGDVGGELGIDNPYIVLNLAAQSIQMEVPVGYSP